MWKMDWNKFVEKGRGCVKLLVMVGKPRVGYNVEEMCEGEWGSVRVVKETCALERGNEVRAVRLRQVTMT